MTLPDIVRYDTFPKLLLWNAETRGARPAMREKDLGIWQTWSWAEVRDEVRAFACGLAALGLERGDRIAIVGDNRPRLYWCMAAAQCFGGIPVPIYQDAVAEEMQFVLAHAGVRFIVAENQEQVDKALAVAERLPGLTRLLYDDGRGLRHYDDPLLISIDAVQEQGRTFDRESPGLFEREIDRGAAGDVAIILYTSGTTGQPKGVVLSFENVIRSSRNAIELEGIDEREEVLAYLPMAWVGDYIFAFGQSYVAGFCISCPESPDTVLNDLREIGPTYYFAPPRIFENLLTQVTLRMQDASRLKRWLFEHFMAVAKRCGGDILDGRPVAIADRLQYALGRVLIYAPLKDSLGLSRVRLAYTAGEAIGPEIFRFYRSLGLNLKQLYGQTEASVFVTIQLNGQVKAESVGPPAREVEVRIADSGEVLFRSPGVFLEYYRNPEATAAAKTGDGWVRSGDAGFFDADGNLKIIDRARDVGRLLDGTLFAPKYVENKLKFFSTIREAVVFGAGRPYCVALINIDFDAVSRWAERRNIPFASYHELAARPEVCELVQGQVEQVNAALAAEPEVAGSQIRRFVLLHKQLDADDGELTRTQKVRRGFVAERYGEVVEALYSDRTRCRVQTQVTYEDGRTDMVTADLAICDLGTRPARLAEAAQ